MPQISINIPDQYVPRIKAALRQFFPEGIDPGTGEPYPEPSDAEYLQALKDFIKQFVQREVRDFETRDAVRTAEAGITDIEVND